MTKSYLDYTLNEFAHVIEKTKFVEAVRNKCKHAANVTRFVYLAVHKQFDGKITEELLIKYKLLIKEVTSASTGAFETILYSTFRVDNMKEVHENVQEFMKEIRTVGELLGKMISNDDNNQSVEDFLTIKSFLEQQDINKEIIM